MSSWKLPDISVWNGDITNVIVLTIHTICKCDNLFFLIANICPDLLIYIMLFLPYLNLWFLKLLLGFFFSCLKINLIVTTLNTITDEFWDSCDQEWVEKQPLSQKYAMQCPSTRFKIYFRGGKSKWPRGYTASLTNQGTQAHPSESHNILSIGNKIHII